jgi:hypothetical protein
VTIMRLGLFRCKWGRENEEVAGRAPTRELDQLACRQLPGNGDARARRQGTMSAAPRGAWCTALDRSVPPSLGTVDGVFWYTKHVHYTLVWICLWN